MRTRNGIRKDNASYRAGLIIKANAMKGEKVPKRHWLPAINRWLTAGDVAKLLDMQVLDHVILASEGYFSFADEALI